MKEEKNISLKNNLYKNLLFQKYVTEGNIYHKPGMSHYIPCLIAE
jgi:hypothetical protein